MLIGFPLNMSIPSFKPSAVISSAISIVAPSPVAFKVPKVPAKNLLALAFLIRPLI